MTQHSLRLLCVTVVVAIGGLVWPSTTFAQDDAFKQGLAARGDKKWPVAAEAMRRAIQADGKESTRKVRSGVLIFGGATEYFPYFFLGEALKNSGDCAGAVTAWETSEEQKAVLTHAEFMRIMRAGYAECAAKGVLLRPDYRQQATATDVAYSEAFGMAERVTKVRTTNPDLWRSDVDAEYARASNELDSARSRLIKARSTRLASDFAESRSASTRAAGLLRPLEAKLVGAISTRTLIEQRSQETQQSIGGAETADRDIEATKLALPPPLHESRQGARTSLVRARERLGVADKTQNPAAADEALKLAQSAQNTLTDILEQLRKIARAEFEQQLQGVISAAHEQFSFVEASLSTLERLIAERPALLNPEMAGERESLQKEFATLRRRFENARRTENMAAVAETTRLASDARARLDALMKAFGPATLRDRGVHAALEQAARLYFQGDYQQSLNTLAPSPELDQAPLQLHIHLFRAASLYTLFVRSNETNEALKNEARAEIARCKEINPAFQPSPRAFGPRFISFFRNANATGTTTASTASP
jgi:hypothetical protein